MHEDPYLIKSAQREEISTTEIANALQCTPEQVRGEIRNLALMGLSRYGPYSRRGYEVASELGVQANDIRLTLPSIRMREHAWKIFEESVQIVSSYDLFPGPQLLIPEGLQRNVVLGAVSVLKSISNGIVVPPAELHRDGIVEVGDHCARVVKDTGQQREIRETWLLARRQLLISASVGASGSYLTAAEGQLVKVAKGNCDRECPSELKGSLTNECVVNPSREWRQRRWSGLLPLLNDRKRMPPPSLILDDNLKWKFQKVSGMWEPQFINTNLPDVSLVSASKSYLNSVWARRDMSDSSDALTNLLTNLIGCRPGSGPGEVNRNAYFIYLQAKAQKDYLRWWVGLEE